jgi:ribonucleoside-triphosphate reductase
MNNLGKNVMFERIRRITGYLVGTIDRWNDAKKAEEKDRVKHGMQKKGGTKNEMD